MINVTSSSNTYDTYSIKNDSLINEYRRAFRLTTKDNVQIYVMPKGKAGNIAGSFIYKSLSNKAQRLVLESNKYKRKIQELQISNLSGDEKFRKLNHLRNSLRYVTNALNAEIAALPRSGFIVVEDDAEN